MEKSAARRLYAVGTTESFEGVRVGRIVRIDGEGKVLVAFAGAAGMYSFENGAPGGLNSYAEALWWTTMVMTTMGSQYWPQTFEGRVLCVFLALYAFAVFGYVTATLATFFIGRDAENDEAELAGAKQLAALREEVIALREEIRRTTAADAVVVKRDSVEERHA